MIPADARAVLVQFSANPAGTETLWGYTSHDRPIVTTDHGLFSALPRMEVDMGKQTGRGENEPVHIDISAVEPLISYTSGQPYPRVKCKIWTCDPADPDGTITYRWNGHVESVLTNSEGRSGVYRAVVGGVLSDAKDHPLGLSATTTCPWRLFDSNCLLDQALFEETPQITAIAGRTITVDALATQTADYWTLGYAKLGDLTIMVRKYAGSTLDLDLVQAPPSSWDGQTITLVPGCDKRIETCRNRYGNEAQFGGCGIAIPSSDPRLAGA